MKLFLTLTFIILTISSHAQINDTFQRVKYSKGNYAIEYPSDWKIDTSRLNGIELAIFSPKENDTDRFSENVNLIIQDLIGQNMDLEKYAQISENQIRKNAIDLKDFNAIKMRSGSSEYYKLTFEMEYGIFKLKTQQYYFIKDEKAFVITFSSEKGKLGTIGQMILDSFLFTK